MNDLPAGQIEFLPKVINLPILIPTPGTIDVLLQHITMGIIEELIILLRGVAQSDFRYHQLLDASVRFPLRSRGKRKGGSDLYSLLYQSVSLLLKGVRF